MSFAAITVVGMNAVQQALQKAGDRYTQASNAAIYQKALEVDRDAVLLTPVDTGRLRNSHYVAPPTSVKGSRVFAEVGFGTDYAVRVHEIDAHHETGEVKFLEKAMNKHASGFRSDLKAKIKANFKKGIGVNAVASTAPKKPKGGK